MLPYTRKSPNPQSSLIEINLFPIFKRTLFKKKKKKPPKLQRNIDLEGMHILVFLKKKRNSTQAS